MKYTLRELYKAGLISYKATFYIDVAEKKESLCKTGMSITQAENYISQNLKISNRTVRRATRAKKILDSVKDT